MIPTPAIINVPLRTDDDGVIRIGSTRVTLETVIHAFQRGETPEQIIDSFDVLKLADVYAVVSYYLEHRDEVDEYMHRAQIEAEIMRQEINKRNTDLPEIRERMLAWSALSSG